MAEQTIYRDIAERTGGDIYIGVVGPVRSGKSTFITRFMQELVLPNMTDVHSRDRARDEMPQSAAGLTVMTTEPKFVPDEGVTVSVGEGVTLRVKLVDCVGYMIPSALGGEENGSARMVRTPWREEPMPFEEAAELGTRKVISEHATVGVLVTSDGTVGDIARSEYEEAEGRLVAEMKALGKPFAVLLNSADTAREESRALAAVLEEKYGVPVALVNCRTLSAADIAGVLSLVLAEFPVTSLGIALPSFMKALPADHALRRSVVEALSEVAGGLSRMGEVANHFATLIGKNGISQIAVDRLDMGTGRAEISVALDRELYYRTASELAGRELVDDGAVLALLGELAGLRNRYERVAEALAEAEQDGYGIVMPALEDMHLEEPTVIRQSGGYGVCLRAAARSIHMIRADIAAEINPIVGTEAQSEELLRSIMSELSSDPARLWHSNMLGKSLYELVGESLRGKLAHMPAEARAKLSETLERIINEGSNGLICILL
ncbi:MAG: stage IV sporulation protein A [Clostridia bacterium]|nr:stage IV sporulation protein A [Clostridia bacterium]